ncbi:MAG: cyclophilin-like fold protein [Candidatus Omnitrophota bacterium]
MKISFQTPTCCFFAEMDKSPLTDQMIRYLPIDSKVSKWGDEIYFETDIVLESSEAATIEVMPGDIAYWPQGKCLCVFFGPTPASSTDKPVPAEPVIVVGKTTHPAAELQQVQAGEPIRVMYVDAPITQPVHRGTDDFPKDRKLSQAEIDDLVQLILAEKKRKS